VHLHTDDVRAPPPDQVDLARARLPLRMSPDRFGWMRSTRWTSDIPAESHYELRDRDGRILGQSGSYGEGCRMLQAYVLAAPGNEDDVLLISLSADGREIAREDLFDIEFGR
jgi:hypothetical protein